MARNRRNRGTTRRRWTLRLIALVVLVGAGFAGWLWWDMREWRPSEETYPEQGAVIASGAATVKFETIKALGGDFAYLQLAPHHTGPDAGFAKRLGDARKAGLKVGVIYPFDPCAKADPQSARFSLMVPRDGDLLPPVIELSDEAATCEPDTTDAAVESELMTLVNQIEMHAGKPVILKLEPAFEARHNTANTLARDLWLVRDRARPDYAPRPWLLWSANKQLVSEASEEPIEWAVVQR